MRSSLLVVLLGLAMSSIAQLPDSVSSRIEGMPSEKRMRYLVRKGWQAHQTNPKKALEFLTVAARDTPSVQNPLLLDSLYRISAMSFGDLDLRSECLNSHLKRIKVLSVRDTILAPLASAYFECAHILFAQGDRETGLKYFRSAADVAERTGVLQVQAQVHMVLASELQEEKQFDSAMYYYQRADTFWRSDNRYPFMIGSLGANMAMLSLAMGDTLSAFNQAKESLEYIDTTQHIGQAIVTLNNAGHVFSKAGKHQLAIQTLMEALAIVKRTKRGYFRKTLYQYISSAYAKQNADSAYKYLSMYVKLNDSIINAENNKTMAELRLRFEDETKQLKIQNLENNKKVLELESERKSGYLLGTVIGLFVLVVGAIFLFTLLKKIRSQKQQVEERKREIEGSINYAKRMQTALIPDNSKLKRLFPESFAIYFPKDELSGDFYWATSVTTSQGMSLRLFAVADCTGHGVPGAFLSVMGVTYLNLGSSNPLVNSPGEALDYLESGIRGTFGESEEVIRDGMDIVMGAIDDETNTMYYACAKNPIFVIRDGEVHVLKGDSKAIGNDDKPEDFKFQNGTFQLQKGDTIYACSDGYQDQFGGDKGKKYKVGKLKKKLLEIEGRSMDEQKRILADEFYAWKGDQEQIDDVSVLGLRI